MSLREPERKPATTLNDEIVVSNEMLKQYLNTEGNVVFLPSGTKLKLKTEEPKKQYTDFRNIYPSQKPIQEPGDFKKKRKRGRPKKKKDKKNKK